MEADMQEISAEKDTATRNAIPRLLTTRETAEILGVKPETLAYWRCVKRYTLPFIKSGRLVRYRIEDIDKFIKSRAVTIEGAEG